MLHNEDVSDVERTGWTPWTWGHLGASDIQTEWEGVTEASQVETSMYRNGDNSRNKCSEELKIKMP